MSVGIMLLPMEGQVPTIDDAHCTLLWAGEYGTHPAGQYLLMAQRCAFLAATTAPFEAIVTGVDVFGDEDERTNVMRIEAVFLYVMRNWVREWNRSEYTEFKPHVSYEQLSEIPPTISFDRIALWLGDRRDGGWYQRTTWRLGTWEKCAG